MGQVKDLDLYDVLIVGGGYGGTALLYNLRKLNSKLKISLIDKEKYHLSQTRLHRYLAGEITFDNTAFSLENFCKKYNSSFINDEVLSVDFENNKIKIKDKEIHYKYLVLAFGSKTFFPKQIKGIKDYAKDIKNIKNSKEYREKFLDILKEGKKSISIIGGGLSGVEIAFEYAYVAKKKNVHLEVNILEASNTLLYGADKFLIEETNKRAKELGINVYTNDSITEVKKDLLIFKSGKELKYDMLIFVGGISSNTIEVPKDTKLNIKNQFITDEFYRVYPNAFILGDILELKVEENKYLPPTAQLAKKCSMSIAKNIIALEENKGLRPFKAKLKGTIVALGGDRAVAKLLGVNIKSSLAKYAKKMTYIIHNKIFS